ncbi:hypothetical protein AB0L34_11790 [Micromonospora sp. NPDC052213]|uniref:hypothetical protein n=1 Tax=Micromonospora sp. NPDC052213 TaxID=3155812 RepID=UPI003441FC02
MAEDWKALTPARRRSLVDALKAKQDSFNQANSALSLFLNFAFDAIKEQQKTTGEILLKLEKPISAGTLGNQTLKLDASTTGNSAKTKKLELTAEELAALVKVMRKSHGIFDLQPQILREMALIYSCALFDGLIADTLQTMFVHVPAQLQSGRRLTYEEALAFDGRQDLIAELAQREMLEVTRQSIEKQIVYFSTAHHVDVLGLAGVRLGDIAKVTEQRNLFVHNNGIASTSYVQKHDNMRIPGERILLEDEELKESIRHLDRVGNSLVNGLVSKFALQEI